MRYFLLNLYPSKTLPGRTLPPPPSSPPPVLLHIIITTIIVVSSLPSEQPPLSSSFGHYSMYFISTQVSISEPLSGRDDKSLSIKNDRRLVMSKVSELYGKAELGGKTFAYDGEKCLYTVGPLPFQTQEFNVLLEDSAFNK